jgi:hypothetical protein
MRISVSPDDAGFRDDAIRFGLKFNGVCAGAAGLCVVTADDRLGEIRFYMRDKEGRFVRGADGAPVIATAPGEVEIVRPAAGC